jgi:hypothetical protein
MRSDLFVGSTRGVRLLLRLSVVVIVVGVVVSSSIGKNAVWSVRRFVIRNYRSLLVCGRRIGIG